MFRTLTLAIFALALAGCGMCNNTIKNEIVSPDGLKKIVIFTCDCGATTAPSTQISILDKDANLPNWFGNAFAGEFSDPVNVTWTDPTHVKITYHGGGRISFRNPDVNGVSVKYIQK